MRARFEEPDALNESVFDRELKTALDVEPSPELLARVRTQLSSEPEPSAWRLSPWLFASGGALAVVVAALVVTSPRNAARFRPADPDPVVAQTLRPAASDPVVTETLRSGPADPVVARTFRSDPSDPVVARTFRSGPADPVVARTFRSALSDSVDAQTFRPAVGDAKPLEVIISPDEVRGLRRLIAMANEEDATLESLLAGPTILAAVGPDGEITLPPISIDPLIPDVDSDTQ